MRRRFLQLLVALAVFALPSLAAVAPARADNASDLLSLVNSLRAAHHVGALSADPTLTRDAQSWSAHMVSAGLVHNPSLATEVGGGWTKLGENIGAGGSVTILFNAFVNSPFHFANMIDPTYNLTGIGVAVGARGTLWVTEDFEAKPGATPATTSPPATTPTTAHPVTTPRTALPTTAAPPTTPVTAAVSTTGPSAVATTLPVAAGTTPPSAPGSVIIPPPTTVPGGLAGAASISAHKDGSSSIGWVLVLVLAGIAALVGGAVVVNRVLRSL
jgi:hypothetical protein